MECFFRNLIFLSYYYNTVKFTAKGQEHVVR